MKLTIIILIVAAGMCRAHPRWQRVFRQPLDEFDDEPTPVPNETEEEPPTHKTEEPPTHKAEEEEEGKTTKQPAEENKARYTGHVPQLKFQYSETYGSGSARMLAEYRSRKLQNSTLGLRGRGGDAEIPFPTYYDQDPSRVIGTRPRTWERWAPAHNYDLLNSGPRNEELRSFNKAAQQHREQYKDHSGTRPVVDKFVQPKISHPTASPPVYRTNCF